MGGSNADAVLRLYSIWNDRGVEDFVAELAPDVSWRGIDTDGVQRTYHGRDEVRALAERLIASFGRARIEAEKLIEVGNEVVVPVRLRPVAAEGEEAGAEPGEAVVPFDLTEVWTFSDEGVPVAFRSYLDRGAALASAERRVASA